MQKQALNVLEMSPLQLFAAAALLGGGGYGLMRYVRDFPLKEDPTEMEPKALTVELPAKEEPLKKQAVDNSAIKKTILKVLAGGVGLPVGFLGAGALYHYFKRKNELEELENAKKEYMDTLSAIKGVKQGEENTPHVDAFCHGIASLEKNAKDILPPNWYQGNIFKELYYPIGKTVTESFAGDISKELLTLLALSGLAAGGITYHTMRKKAPKDPYKNEPLQQVKIKYV